MISFARGAPAPECLDAELLADCARAAIEGDPSVLAYGAGGGYGPLREWLGGRHGVDPARVIVTNGGLQGFVFYAEELLAERPGRVLVEAPTYDRPLKILARLGADVRAVAMDGEGLDPDALERELAGGDTSFLYTIPTFQNPSGRTLSTERRRRVAELAGAHGVPVLEDDPYGLVRYEGEAPPSLHELEGGELVTYASSFSKTVAPGVRVGWFVAPAGLAARLEARAVSNYISPPFITQATVHELIDRGAFEPNLERVRGLLGARRDAMLDALARTSTARRAGASPRAATSSGSTFRSRRTSCSRRPRRRGSRSSRAPTSSPAARTARGQRGWRSATRRRRRSARASRSSRPSCADGARGAARAAHRRRARRAATGG